MEKVLWNPVSKKHLVPVFPARGEAREVPIAVITDARGNVVSVNAGFEMATGYSRYEVIGKNVAELKNGGRDGKLYRAIWAVISRWDSGEASLGTTDAGSDGRTVQVIPLCDPAGETSNYAAICHSGASFPAWQGTTEKSPAKLITRLAAGIAHNFGNLLTVIIGNAQRLLAQPTDGSGNRREIEEIRDAAEKGAEMVQKLLAFGRAQVLKPETVNLNRVVRRGLDGILPRLGEGIELREDLAPDIGWLRVDLVQFEWIFTVLAENACGNMPGGGQLTVATANVDLKESVVRQNVSVRRGRYVMVSFHNTGVALQTETAPRIFEPFFNTIEDPKGLSLAAVYGAVKQSGGYIWVFSSPGRGTSFKLYFPRVEDP